MRYLNGNMLIGAEQSQARLNNATYLCARCIAKAGAKPISRGVEKWCEGCEDKTEVFKTIKTGEDL